MNTYYFYGKDLDKLTNVVVISRTLTHGTKMMLERKGIQYTTCVELQPDWKTMVGPYRDGVITEAEYEKLYSTQLDKLNPHEMFKQLGVDATLICYEDPKKFCHRHTVAKWFRTHGYMVEELDPTQQHLKTLDVDWIL